MTDALTPPANPGTEFYGLYPEMAPEPNVVPHTMGATVLDALYPEMVGMFDAPPPELPPEAMLYPEMFDTFTPILREQEDAWRRQTAAIPAADQALAAQALASLPPTVRGTLVGAGVDFHPEIVAWLARLGGGAGR